MFHRFRSRRSGGRRRYAVAVMAVVGLIVGSSALYAQSGSRQPGRTQDSTMRPPAASQAAMDGFCPVCIIEMKRWVRGNAAVSASYDGKMYYFPGQEQKEMFLADPAKYVPALGGDCTVCYVNMKKRVPGSVFHAALSGKRLFLFPNKELQQEFLTNSRKYADVDLALGGNCSVCRVEMGEDVPGKPEIAVVHKGFRYLFPSDEQRKMFLANPAKYEGRPPTSDQSSNVPAPPHERLVNFRGKSGCAGCDHGVAPIGAPDELGLAVSTANGDVYVVEDAHTHYPNIYERRFEGLALDVTGRVIKRQGKIVWVQPAEVNVLN